MRATSWVENAGILRAFDSRPITPMAVPSDTRAEVSGISAASNEPKTSNSTIPAARMPKPLPPGDGGVADSATWPPTATWRAPPPAAVAVLTRDLASAMGRF